MINNNAGAKLEWVDVTELHSKKVIKSPLSGIVTTVSKSYNPIFKHHLLGEGIVIELTGNELLAPFSGKVMTIQLALRQIILQSTQGLQVLIKIADQEFNTDKSVISPKIHQGQQFQAQQLLCTIDRFTIQQKISTIRCPVIILNHHKLSRIYACERRITAGKDQLLGL